MFLSICQQDDSELYRARVATAEFCARSMDRYREALRLRLIVVVLRKRRAGDYDNIRPTAGGWKNGERSVVFSERVPKRTCDREKGNS